MITILAFIGVAALLFLACAWVFLFIDHFERLKRIEAAVDLIRERLDTSEEKGKYETE